MGDAIRRYTAENPAPDDWWAGPEAAPATEVLNDYAEQDGVMALERLSTALHMMNDATTETDLTVADATRYMAERLDVDAMAATVALVQDLKRRLGLIESYVAREAGLAAVEVGKAREGYLADGRQWTLKRGNERKAWDHDGWKAAARAAIIKGHDLPPDLVDPSTGEEVNLYTLLAEVQEVHGSTAPRVGQLKALAIDPKDYCEQTPGPWGFTVVAPSDNPNPAE